ncbi:NAD(P)H:quinone oxidoreductase [Niallia taxi]|uniref:NAD(P)H:quinone oxidoreductase n=1 Tax=Niallia taxi TaxID=2499688 RepID=UPI00119D932F|nr:NAD(P)H:quinone oxidoreductase [Niallia taxi]MCM3214184.1 NAD(P)H:quinone oxidoreductase [Niallia taxi]MCT2343434.1 NAD(P)H:quinone oxidoreductase [Niallia taxi]MED3963533.1 NAD(P)H:quinone oxidoreductase [Niallia taxi]MED4040853.1 NAD(P)H:quinone oxidoreductase [Niallia taxi]MED4052779.1 NAD(P)H:quinone oxidoreductase [Niallia taxi]
MTVKLAIVYYSSTGTNYQLAQWAAEGAKESGADVTIYRVEETVPQSVIEGNPAWKAHVEETKDIPVITPDDIVNADAIIFSTPTRFGNVAAQMKQFLDTTGGIWFNGKTVNKVVSAMTSAQNPHGGQEATILSLYTTMYHWGAIVVTPGYTDQSLYAAGGNPYGTSVSVDQNNEIVGDKEVYKKAVQHQAKRVVTVADWVKKGNQ